MSGAEKNAPGWRIDAVPLGATPDQTPRPMLELQFASDLRSFELKRIMPDGQTYSVFLTCENVGDLNRIFACEIIAVLMSEAQRSFRRRGLPATLPEPIRFSAQGHIISEILCGNKVYSRVLFNPDARELRLFMEESETVISLNTVESLGAELVRLLGLKLPVTNV